MIQSTSLKIKNARLGACFGGDLIQKPEAEDIIYIFDLKIFGKVKVLPDIRIVSELK
jgi:hypothetical protein